MAVYGPPAGGEAGQAGGLCVTVWMVDHTV